jgi:FtsZ-binding cell division protein ZapB
MDSSQNDYKCLLEKIETFVNLNCELTTKIEKLESNAPSSAIDESLIKKNEKLKAKLASSQEAIENLLGKMEILSIHNNECWGLVLKCCALRTRQHKNRLMVNTLRPSKHYFLKDITIFG